MKAENRNNQVQKLKRLKYELINKYNEYKSFKKIYESANNKKSKPDKIVISNDSGKDILSGISEDIIKYFKDNEYFVENIYDPETKEITINNYYELLQTIRILIDILDLGLLTKNFNDFFNQPPNRN